MKIRKGFISNSSSSSFICDICGEEACGMDIDLSDYELFICDKNHVICESHLKKESLTEAFTKDILLKYLDPKWYQETINEIKEMTENEFKVWKEEEGYEILAEMRYEVPVELCPICCLEKFNAEIYSNYILKINNSTEEEAVKELKEKFGNLENLKKFIENK